MNIESEINHILATEFEINPEKLTAKAHLFDELGLDSLDAADLLVILEEKTEKQIDGSLFMEARKLGDVYEIVERIVNVH